MKQLTPMEVLKPIPPGISWTDEPKSRPWQTPPKLTKITDVAQGYIDILSEKSIITPLLDTLESGLTLDVIAETLMLGGVHKGIHTIDAGILVMPVIVEMLKTLADIHGVDVKTYAAELESPELPARVLKRAIASSTSTADKEMEEEVVVPLEKPAGGLMGRPQKEVI